MRKFKVPLGSFFSKISDDDRFFCDVLDRTGSKIQNIREVNHSSLSNGQNGNNEFLPFSYNNELILVVDLGLG